MEPQPSQSATLKDAIDRVASALEAANEKQPSDDDTDRAQRDVRAQEAMALWAIIMTIATISGVGVGAYSLRLLWRTVEFTREGAEAARAAVTEAEKATVAAEKAVEETRRTGYSQVRAFLGISKLNGNSHFKLRGMSTNSMWVHVSIRNDGQTPARDVNTDVILWRLEGDQRHIAARRDFRYEVEDIGPTEVRVIFNQDVQFNDRDTELMFLGKEPRFRLEGRVRYRPAVGTHFQKLDFSYEVSGQEDSNEPKFVRSPQGNEAS